MSSLHKRKAGNGTGLLNFVREGLITMLLCFIHLQSFEFVLCFESLNATFYDPHKYCISYHRLLLRHLQSLIVMDIKIQGTITRSVASISSVQFIL